MKKQVKTQIGKDDNILWVSKAGNCIAFKSVPGYQPMTMETSNELWALVEQPVVTSCSTNAHNSLEVSMVIG